MSDTLLSDLEAEDITNHFDSLPPDQQPVARNRLRAYFDEKDRRRAEAFRSVESLMLDAPEDFAKSNPAAVKPLMQPDDWDETRELAGLSTLTGADPRRISKAPGAFRAAVADSWGQPDIATDVPKFRARLKAHFQKSRDIRLLGENLDTEATRSELIRDAAFTPEMITANASDIPSWEKWSFNAPGKPGFDQAQTGAYFAKWAAAQERVRKLTAPLRGQINEAWTTLSGDPNAGEVLGLADVLSQMPTKDRRTVLWAIQQRAEAMPEAQKKQFWDRAGRAFMSSLDQMLTGMATGPERIGDMVFRDFGASPEDRAQLRKRQDTLEELRSLQTSKLQPFESSDDGLLAKVGLGAMQSAPALAAAFAGPVGWYGIGAQMTDESRAAVRPALEKALQAQGLDADQADERAGVIAEPLAIAAGAINTAVEKLTFGIATGIPGVRGLQAKLIAATSESLAKRIALRGAAFALEAGEQQLQEAVQDAMPFALADAAKAVGVSVPDFVNEDGSKSRWITEAGRVFAKTALDPTTLGVSLLFAAGGFGHVDGVTLAEGLRREGVESSAIEQVLSAAPEQRAEAAIAAIEAVPPEAKAQAKEAAATQDAAAKAAGALGVLPTFRVNPDGIGVFFDGQHIGTAPTTQAAMELAAAASEHFADMDADQTALLASMLETADVFATQEDAGKVAYTEVSPNKRTVAQQLAESAATGDVTTEARLREEIRLMAEAEGVDPDTLSLIAGDNVTTFQNNVAHSVSRVFEGASPLTVVHENAHGSFKAGLRNGTFTREGTIGVVRGVEQATGQKFFQSADDSAIGEAELEETVMQLAEAEVLGRRKRGDALAPGAITKGIAAYIRQEAKAGAQAEAKAKAAADAAANPDAQARPTPVAEALKFKHFISAVRRMMKQVFQRALALRKAQVEGKLGDDYHSFLNKLLGVDSQISHDQAVADAVGEYIPPTPAQEAAGMAFALAPAGRLAAVESRVQQALDKDPEMKRRVYSDIRAKLARLTSDWSNVRWTARGDKIAPIVEKRSAKSLDKEQAFREAARRSELNDLYAGPIEHQFAGILNQPELAQFRERPLFIALGKSKRGIWRGRIMSKRALDLWEQSRQQTAKHKAWDNADGIPSIFFGGTEKPNEVADDLYKQGLLKSDSEDDLWDAIKAELADVAKKKDDLKYALDKLKEAQKRAKDEAKAEAAQWRAEQDAAQKKDHSPKAAMLRDLVTLDAMLAALPAEVRAKVGGYVSVARLGSDASRLAELQRRADMIGREMEAHLRQFYGDEVQKLFDRAKPSKGGPGEKPIGKVGADVYKLVQAAAGAMSLTPDETDASLAEIDTLLAADDLSPEAEAMLQRERGLVELFGAWHPKSIASQRLDKNGNPIYVRAYDGADAARRAAAFDSLKTLIDEGMADWKQELTRRKERRDAMRAALKASTGKSGARSERVSKDKEAKTLFGKGLNFLLSISSFDEVARYAFGDGSSEARAMVDQERAASNAYEDEMQDVTDSVQALFEDMAGSPLEAEKLRFQLSQRTKDGGVAGEMSELEIIQAVLMWRQEDGRRHMTGPLDEDGKPAGPWHFDQAWVDSVTAQLSPEGRRVLDHIAQEYAAEYATLNPLYEQRHGISLPANANYAPITVAPQQASAGQMVDPVSGAAVTGSILTPGSLRTRSRSAVAEPDFKDGLQVFLAHKRQMAHWKAYYDFAVEAQQVLGNREVGNAVSAAAGEQAKVVLRKWVDAFAQGGSRDAAAGLAATDTLQRMTGRAAAAALVGRVSVLMIQSTQLAAAAVEMPDGGYLKRLGKLLSGNLGWGDAIRSDYIQRRLSQQPPIIRQAMEALANQTEPNRLKHEVARLGRLINGADGLFTAGTYAMLLDYHRQNAAKLGMKGAEAEKFAHENAARSTDRVAQPMRMGARSIWEVTSTNPLARLSWAFASEARQKISIVAWSGVNIRTNPKRFAKAVFLAWVVGGVAAEVIRSAYRDLKDDDDEEVFDARNWSPSRLALSALAGPLKGVPGLSAIFETGGNLFSSGQRGMAAAQSLFSGDSFDSDEPVEETLRDVDSILTAMALFNDNAAAIASLAHAGLDGAKLIDSLSDDDVEAGLKQLRKEAADRKQAKGEPSSDQADAAQERKRARIKAAAERAKSN